MVALAFQLPMAAAQPAKSNSGTGAGIELPSDRVRAKQQTGTQPEKPTAPQKPKFDFPKGAIKTDGSEIGITIVGAIVHKNKKGSDNVALIKEKSGRIAAVKKDHMIMDDKYKVIAIYEKYIDLLARDSKRYVVYQNKFAREFATTERSGQEAAGAANDYYKEDGFERSRDQVKMSAFYRDKLVSEDLAKILMQATAEPHFEDGKMVGFLISQIDKGSIYDKGGFIDGDVITSINGNQLTSVAGAISLLKSLKNADGIDMEFIRGDQARKMKIEIQ